MRLRFLTSTPLSIERGSGTFVGIQGLAKALRGLGVEVELVSPILHLPVYTLERLLFNEMLRLRPARGFHAIVGFDMDGYRIAQNSVMPHVASLKGVIADEVRFQTGVTRATMAIQAKCEAVHVRHADRVLTTSQYAAARAEEFYGVRPRVVPELIDLDEWRRLRELHLCQQDPKKFIVLCVCRLYRRKRVDLLLGAAARLRDHIPGLEVRIVGNGPEAGDFRRVWREKRLENTVRFLGDVSRAELAAEYNRCDIFCLPSVQEGFGIVFLEAMAAGKPIVAARAAAVPEVVKHGELVEPDNEVALTEAIEALYRSPGRRSALGTAGSQWVRQFDAPRVARLFLAEVEKVMGTGDPSQLNTTL